jgi:3-methyl-2-oxobutanoate hydroxymethyltransferase
MSSHKDIRRTTVTRLHTMKAEGEKIACLTAYDASFARVLDAAGMDVILVGDSLGMVVQGHDTTVPVTVDDVLYHTRSVARGCTRALLMADMPFMSYPTSEAALHNAARFLQEGGAQMVKLEGGAAQIETVRRLSENGIPVCAHLGLKPQSIHKLGAYRVQGRDAAAADAMVKEAQGLVEAGADLLLLECVPTRLANRIRDAVPIPVIGIGAGAGCDGQILVLHDVLELTPGAQMPRFAKDFLAGKDSIRGAIEDYVAQVKNGRFPAPEHGF